MFRLQAKYRTRINAKLAEICSKRHPALPLKDIGIALLFGSVKIEEAIYCGREGRCNSTLYTLAGEEISNSMLVLYWLKGTETETYEINAYVS